MELNYKGKKEISEIKAIIEEKSSTLPAISSTNKNGLYIYGDNFDVMSQLLQNYRGKVDLIYIDPPFNTTGTFFYNEERTSTISHSKKDQLAYNDNLTLDEYLEFIRERAFLMRELLSEKGSLYFHIDSKVGHYVKIILDEVFGNENFVNDISRIKSNPKNFSRNAFGNEKDVIYIYSKTPKKNIFNNITQPLSKDDISRLFGKVDEKGRAYTTVPCHAPGETASGPTGGLWRDMAPPPGRHWRCNPEELERLDKEGLIEWSSKGNPRIKKFADDSKGKKIQDVWLDYKDPQYPIYPTEKNSEMLDMIVKQSSNENSIIMDCFCGSGSLLKAGLRNNRKVIGIDKSEASIACISKSSELKNLDFINIPGGFNFQKPEPELDLFESCMDKKIG